MTATATARYARRAANFRPSPVRSVWDVAAAPGMISFAGGNPDISGLPLVELGEASARLIREHGTATLQYSAGAGIPRLRAELASLMAGSGITADPDDVLITAGSQMALELVTALYCDPGDVILTESPTYTGALSIFAGLEAAVEHVPCDQDGLIPSALEERIRTLRDAGHTIKLLYTIPNFSNPSGVTLTHSRRLLIARTCAEAGILIVEDDPYGLVRFDGDPVTAIRAGDPTVIYLGSMSKIFSPGIRVGWMLAPTAVRQRLQLLSEATTIHASTLSQYLAVEYLQSMPWRDHLAATVARYRRHAEALLEALSTTADALPAGSTWTRPAGGFFVWATLPDGFSARDLFDLAVDEHVVFIPGTAFYANGRGTANLRLSYSLTPPDVIRQGVDRLARATRRLHRTPA